MQKKSVAIIGGGISGLLTAFLLRLKGHQVELFEAHDRFGGWVQSEKFESWLFEWGPHSILMDEDWQQIFLRLGLKKQSLRPGVRNRFVWKEGRKLKLPLNPFQFLSSDIVSRSTKLKIFSSLLSGHSEHESDLSIARFFSRHFGEETTKYIVDPFVGGIFAGDVHKLSMKACFPDFWRSFHSGSSLAKQVFSKKKTPKETVSLKGGLGQLIESLARQMEGHLRSSASVNELVRGNQWELRLPEGSKTFDEVVVAIPSEPAAHLLLDHVERPHVQFLKKIQYQRVAMWQTIWQRPKKFATGYGCLVPRSEGQALLGSLWASEMFEERCDPEQLLTVQFFSGSEIPQDPHSEEAFLMKLVGSDLPAFASRYRVHEKAIPQFSLGHRESVENLRKALPQGLHLVGNYLDGVGLSSVLKTAKSVVSQI